MSTEAALRRLDLQTREALDQYAARVVRKLPVNFLPQHHVQIAVWPPTDHVFAIARRQRFPREAMEVE